MIFPNQFKLRSLPQFVPLVIYHFSGQVFWCKWNAKKAKDNIKELPLPTASYTEVDEGIEGQNEADKKEFWVMYLNGTTTEIYTHVSNVAKNKIVSPLDNLRLEKKNEK